MRSLSVREIDNLVESLRTFVGARLQEAVVGKSGCALGLFHNGEIVWLWFDGHTWSPMLLPLTEAPEAALKPAKPLQLFLRAHFTGHRLTGVGRREDLGRAIELGFGGEEQRRIEVRLWPHGGNLIAAADGKRVAWRKPTDEGPGLKTAMAEPEARTLETILDEWIQLRFARKDVGAKEKAKKSKDSPEARREKEIARLEKAVSKVREEIAAKSETPWRAVGEWLTGNQSLGAPENLRAFIDQRRSLAWNIENCFTRAKEVEKKLVSTHERLARLEQDLAVARTAPLSQMPAHAAGQVRAKSKGAAGGAKYRTVNLPGGLTAKVGKSAQDNIQLLRNARPWDLWMHLRDYPGSHAIVSREKSKNVSDETLRAVGAALVDQTFGAKSKQHSGERFEMIVAECRFVRPIKGDRHGRVTYTHDRTVGFRCP